jgi:hypothetical protein
MSRCDALIVACVTSPRDIAGVSSAISERNVRSQLRAIAPVLLLSTLALTLLFSAQDAMRGTITGQPFDWFQTLRINALDWVVWSAMVPFIAIIGRAYRLDVARKRIARVIIWIGLALGATLTESLVTGIVVRSWGLTFGPPGAGPMPLHRYLVAWTVGTSGFNLITFFMIAALFHAALYYGDLRARRLREADLERRLARSVAST